MLQLEGIEPCKQVHNANLELLCSLQSSDGHIKRRKVSGAICSPLPSAVRRTSTCGSGSPTDPGCLWPLYGFDSTMPVSVMPYLQAQHHACLRHAIPASTASPVQIGAGRPSKQCYCCF